VTAYKEALIKKFCGSNNAIFEDTIIIFLGGSILNFDNKGNIENNHCRNIEYDFGKRENN